MVDDVWRDGKKGKAGWETKLIDCPDPFFFSCHDLMQNVSLM